MNWTGGALGRSRNINDSTFLMQRKHFAKARGKLQASHRTPPEPILLFGKIPVRPAARIASSRLASARGSTSEVSGSGRRRQVNGIDSRCSQQTSRRKRRRQSGANDGLLHQHDDTGFRSRSRHASHSSSRSMASHAHSLLSKKEDTDPLRPDATSIEAKRAYLLQSHDWVGLSHTRPAKMNFLDTNDKDQIGKRRKISRVQRREGSVQVRHQYSINEAHERDPFGLFDKLSQAEISVRIGSAVDRRSVRPKSVRDRRYRDEYHPTETVSDEMLMDTCYDRSQSASSSPSVELLRPQPWTSSRDDELRHDIPNYANIDTAPRKPVLMLRRPDGHTTPFQLAFSHTPQPRTSTRVSKDPGSSARPSNGRSSPVCSAIEGEALGNSRARRQVYFNTAGEAMTTFLSSNSVTGSPISDTDLASSKNYYEDQEQSSEYSSLKTISAKEIQAVILPTSPQVSSEKDITFAATKLCSFNKETPATQGPFKSTSKEIDEDEALWRQFVFDGAPIDDDWIVEESPMSGNEVQDSGRASTTSDHSRQSMDAEVATSPLKQNPHLAQDMSSSTSRSVDSTPSSAQPASVFGTDPDSDEMLDTYTALNSSSSAARSISQVETQSPESPEDPIRNPENPFQGNPSSLKVQASSLSSSVTAPTPAMNMPSPVVAQASSRVAAAVPTSDELAWSPRHISHHDPSKSTRTTSDPQVLFKKPRRYVGARLPEQQDPMCIGGKSVRRQEQEAADDASTMRDEMWATGAARLEDDIEDD